MHYYRGQPDQRGFFLLGAPFIGGLLGGLVGSALFRPYYGFTPFPYGPVPPFSPYGYGGYGFGYGYGAPYYY